MTIDDLLSFQFLYDPIKPYPRLKKLDCTIQFQFLYDPIKPKKSGRFVYDKILFQHFTSPKTHR